MWRKPGAPLNWRVDKMKLTPDKTALIYNNFLTLEGIPPEVFAYKLGNRSALEWVIDQYKVSTDPRSGITNDPNRPDDPQYIVRLLGQVITVSLETLKIIQTLPRWNHVGRESEAIAFPSFPSCTWERPLPKLAGPPSPLFAPMLRVV